MKRRIIGLLLISLLLLGCSQNIPEGTVTGHNHQGSYTTITWIWINKVMYPQTQFHPERWSLYVVAPCPTEKDCVKGWVDVTSDTYYAYPDGSYIRFKQ